jgi:predicted transcriptional regulator
MTTKKPTLLIRLDARTKAELKKAADAEDRSMAWMVEKAVEEWLLRQKRKKPRA